MATLLPMVYRSRIPTLLLLCLLTLNGCYSGYYLTTAETDSGTVRAYPKTQDIQKFPVYVASVIDDQADETEDQAGTTYALGRSLGKTGLYPAVHVVPPQGDFIEANLAIRPITNEDEQAANTAKMVFTGSSLFLFAAALPQTNHFDADYTLHVNWPNHGERRYRAHCGAYSYATIDKYRDVQRSAKDLIQTACLNSLVNQMSEDYPRMMKGKIFMPPKGMTTGQLKQWGRVKDPNQAKPEAVCTEVGLTPGTKSYGDCLAELK